MPDPREVRSMFGRIAGRYDLLNRVLSFGIDRSWRARTVRRAGPIAGRTVVDACCGTGDLALEFAKHGGRVVGIDFTPEMLQRAGPKARSAGSSAAFLHGDAMRLPLKSASADVCSVAFGVRNLADPDAGLVELARVLKPGARLFVLEFSPPPRGPFGLLCRVYFGHVLPRLGGWISGDGEAYRYLPRTIGAWSEPREMQQRMERAGLVECGFECMTFGIASLHWGRRP